MNRFRSQVEKTMTEKGIQQLICRRMNKSSINGSEFGIVRYPENRRFCSHASKENSHESYIRMCCLDEKFSFFLIRHDFFNNIRVS